jgi:hypothetical protein
MAGGDDECKVAPIIHVGTSDDEVDGGVPAEEETEQHVSAAVAAAAAGNQWACGKLDLRGCSHAGFSISAVTVAGCLKGLTYLNLEFAIAVTDAHVAALAEWGTLKKVNLNAAQDVGDDAVKALARSCPELTEIGLYWNVRVGLWGGCLPSCVGDRVLVKDFSARLLSTPFFLCSPPRASKPNQPILTRT